MGGDPQRLQDVLGSMLGSGGVMRMNAHKRALALWMRVNGDIERQHTCGAFIKNVPHADPLLVIYLDSRMRVVDFSANREIYLRRLASQGMPLSRIEFKLAKNVPEKSTAVEEAVDPVLPELGSQELDYVRSATEMLPEPLRTSVSKAMISSLRREKASHS